jgi:hypothetical protein
LRLKEIRIAKGLAFVFEIILVLFCNGRGDGEVGPNPIYAFINIDAITITKTINSPL